VSEGDRRRLARGVASYTAEINAAMRAAEATRRPRRRLFDDPYALEFVQDPRFRALCRAGPVGRLSLTLLDRRFPGMTGEIILRNRYWDEVLDGALADGVEQIVLLGAGYDSTALRRRLADGVRVYEVDSPPTQEAKRRTMERRGIAAPDHVTFVPCDFEVHRVADRLAETGFDAGGRSAVAWLGVSYYLTDEALRWALADLASLAAAGSRLVMDYMDGAVIDGTTPHVGAVRAVRSVESRGEPYRFGTTPEGIRALLDEFGFELRTHLRLDELAARYGNGRVWCRTDDWIRVVGAERSAG
jgi:methyltransferase (TIGR00027 family)